MYYVGSYPKERILMIMKATIISPLNCMGLIVSVIDQSYRFHIFTSGDATIRNDFEMLHRLMLTSEMPMIHLC